MKYLLCASCLLLIYVSSVCVTFAYDGQENNNTTIKSDFFLDTLTNISEHFTLRNKREGGVSHIDVTGPSRFSFTLLDDHGPLKPLNTRLTLNSFQVVKTESDENRFDCRSNCQNCTCRFSEDVPDLSLFGSHEFRINLKDRPRWMRAIKSVEDQIEAIYACGVSVEVCSATTVRWQEIIMQSQSLNGLEQLKMVNSFFNRWPYRLDLDVYGVSDYWATPDEFLKFSGDCEDYSLIKYYALRKLGYAADNMRIVLLKDNIRNVSHTILAVNLNGEIYVLDNMSDLVLSHLKYEQYIPKSSVNEYSRWAYVSSDVLY